MISVNKEVKNAFESTEAKNLILEFDDGTIVDNDDIAMESMELTQSITEDDALCFGEINSSCFKVKVTGSPKKYKGLWFNASLNCGEYSLPLGRFCVDSDEYTSGRQYRNIVAYDALAYIVNTDVTEWYESLDFPISIYTMRNSLFSFLGIEQEEAMLINDAYMVEKTIDGEEISASMVLHAICELNATFGVINNYGKFKYVLINNLADSGLFPSDELNPDESLYPEDIYDDVLTKADYLQDSLTYEEFETANITKLRIQEVENDIGVSVGTEGNEYIIGDNFLTYGDTQENLLVVVENIFDYAKDLTYTPAELSCSGVLWREVGDMLQVYADDKVFNMPILSRTLSGIQAVKDTYTAQGTEYYEEQQESEIKTEIKKLKSRSNVLVRTIDETRSEISRIETEAKDYTDKAIEESAADSDEKIDEKLKSYTTTTDMNSKIEQTANSLTSSINEKTEETKNYIDGEITTTKEALSSKIEQTASSLKSDISKTYVTNGSLEEATNYLQQQIDGAIETFSGSSVPTLSNSPASGWTTNEIKDTHVGDLYIVNSNGGDYAGFYYRFEKSGSTYQWTLLKDNEITKALQDAKEANDKAKAVAKELAENYITSSETTSAINQAVDNIQLSVSEKYSTKAEVTSAKSEAISSANTNTANQLKNYSTTADSKAYADSVSNTALDSAKQYTDNVEVGGRNLLLKSDTEVSTANYAVAYYYFGNEKPVEGEEYTITIKGTLGSDRVYFRAYNSGGTVVFGTLIDKGNGLYSYTGKWIITAGSHTALNNRIYIYQMHSNCTSTSTIEWIKLEKGNKATDWTPAPEDVSADATNKANTALANAKADTDTKLTSYSTTTEMNSAINLKADSITQTVNEKITETKTYALGVANTAESNAKADTDNKLKSYTTTTDMNSLIDQTATSIKTEVNKTYTTKTDFENLQVGGRNYIVLSKLGSYTPYNTTPIASGNVITTTFNSTATYKYLSLNVSGFTPPAGVCTLSGYIKVNGKIPTNDIFVSEVCTYGSNQIVSEYDSTTGYFVKTQTYNGTKSWIIHATTNLTVGSAEVLTFTKLKFETGNKATDWTPAPEDVENKFNDYSTTEETKSLIEQSANSITSTVSSTYATKSDLSETNNNLADNYTKKTIPDTRNDNQNPQWYMTNYPRQIITEFKYCSVIGVSGDTYCTLTTYVPWNGSSGGYPKQVASVKGKEYWRTGTSNTAWGSWNDALGIAQNAQSRVTSAESNITQLSDKITATVKVTDSLGTRMTAIEQDSESISSTVSGLKTTADQKGYKYYYKLTMYGESNKYYPVVLRGGDQSTGRKIMVRRSYSEKAPSDWYNNSTTHHGGLYLLISATFGGWGGAGYMWNIDHLEECYCNMFAGAGLCMSYQGFYIYLRGGGDTGAVYHIYSDQAIEYTFQNGTSPQICYESDVIGWSGGTADNPTYKWTAPAPRTWSDEIAEAIKAKQYVYVATDARNRVSTAETKITQLNDKVTIHAEEISDLGDDLADFVVATDELKSQITSTKKAIDNLEIGGRNLLLGTNNGIANWNSIQIASGGTASIQSAVFSELGDVNGVTITMTKTSGSWQYASYQCDTLRSILYNNADEEFVISFDVKPSIAIVLDVSYKNGEGTYPLLSFGTVSLTASAWNHVELVTKAVKNNTSNQVLFIDLSKMTTGSTLSIANLKLEKGNRASEWTPAVEDMATGIDIDNVNASIQTTNNRVSTSESLIQQLSDSLSTLITDSNGTSLMKQTSTGWTFSTGSLQSSVNDISKNLADLTASLENTDDTVDILNQAVNDIGTLTEYVKIGTYDGEPCIELGEGDSDFKLLITNTRIMFREGSNIPAYFNNNSLYINKAVVENELQQGGFTWVVRNNGNLGLIWKG